MNSDCEVNDGVLMEEAVKYFAKLYSVDDENIQPWQLIGCFPHLSIDEYEALARNIDNEEVKALFHMGWIL